jgi:hypothetical protein
LDLFIVVMFIESSMLKEKECGDKSDISELRGGGGGRKKVKMRWGEGNKEKE